MSKIEEKVCERILERAETGKSKYGVTMEREDLSRLEWLKHAFEESADLAVYLQKLIEIEGEEWRSIPNYEGIYEVSSLGRVRSIDRTTTTPDGRSWRTKGRILVQGKTKDGYKKIMLSKSNKVKSFLVHRLVAVCFIDNPEGKETVNHKDGDKSNNTPENLEWMSHKENMNHAKNDLKRFPFDIILNKDTGEELPLDVLAEKLDIKVNTLSCGISRGWSKYQKYEKIKKNNPR
jgi:hypothetical protein